MYRTKNSRFYLSFIWSLQDSFHLFVRIISYNLTIVHFDTNPLQVHDTDYPDNKK